MNNEESAINLCKKNAIIDFIIKLANQWLLEVATRTLIGALQFCRTWSVYLQLGDHAVLKETSARGRDIIALPRAILEPQLCVYSFVYWWYWLNWALLQFKSPNKFLSPLGCSKYQGGLKLVIMHCILSCIIIMWHYIVSWICIFN